MNLFTVEQLELVRRLRQTGMTSDAILEAYRSLDQIETELRGQHLSSLMNYKNENPTKPSKVSSPVVSAISQMNSQLQTSPPAALAADQLSSPIVRHLNSQALQQFAQRESAARALTTVPESCLFGTPLFSAGLPLSATQSQLSPQGCQTTPSSASCSNISTTQPIFSAEHFRFPTNGQFCAPNLNGCPDLLSQGSSMIPIPSSNVCRPLRTSQHQRGNQRNDHILENPNELEEFMQQGEEYCINEMKKFITQYSLRQTTVAQMTGVSQPYISKLLNGNHRELSLRCRRNIYAWYLNCRRHPDPTTRLETNGDGELVPQRRERYVFRPILIRILEAYFAESPFPDTQKRAEISQSCNNALQVEKKGNHLMPKEVVTPQVIANWFANKRKEMRRKSNEENRPRNLMAGTQPLSDIASSPSPSNSSSTANADSPAMLPHSLLAPLQFQQNPLAMLIHQHQAQQPGSVENFLEARPPILQQMTFPSNLSQFFFNNKPIQQQMSNEGEEIESNSTTTQNHHLNELFSQQKQVKQETENLTEPSEQAVDERKSVTNQLLCRVEDGTESNDRDVESIKPMMNNDLEQISQDQQNPAAYMELLQKLMGAGMLNLLQQSTPSTIIE